MQRRVGQQPDDHRRWNARRIERRKRRTTMSMFKPATKKQSKLRLALTGPSGSGKKFSALSIASGLGERIAVIDTEHGSASLYADKFKFDVCNLESFSPDAYVEALKGAEEAGYDVVII